MLPLRTDNPSGPCRYRAAQPSAKSGAHRARPAAWQPLKTDHGQLVPRFGDCSWRSPKALLRPLRNHSKKTTASRRLPPPRFAAACAFTFPSVKTAAIKKMESKAYAGLTCAIGKRGSARSRSARPCLGRFVAAGRCARNSPSDLLAEQNQPRFCRHRLARHAARARKCVRENCKPSSGICVSAQAA